MRGDGRIYQRTNSPYWWVAYYHNGTQQREVALRARSGKNQGEKLLATEENRAEAERFLRKCIDAITTERNNGPAFLGPQGRRLSVNEILDKLEARYKLGGKRGIPREVPPEMHSALKRLRDYFGDTRAVAIDESRIQEFVSYLLDQGKANGTVNRSLQLLKQAYSVSSVPCAFSKVASLDESESVRKGKLTPAEVIRVAASLPKYLSDVVRFAYETGARSGEIRKLRWSYLQGDVIAVPASDTKNRKPRFIVITAELEQILTRRRAARAADCDLIFHHDGHRITDYRRSWRSACVINGLGKFYCRDCRNEKGELDYVLDAGKKCPRCGKRWEVPRYVGKLMHDLRRSACHEMWRSGSTIEECMEVSGHRSNSMFRRYADLFSDSERQAMQRKVQERRAHWRDAQFEQMAPAGTA